MDMNDVVKGKVALVTGGIGGLGTATCLRLADSGYRVVANYLPSTETQAKVWQQQWQGKGYSFTIYPCDVGRLEDCERMAVNINKDLGGVDILVNNAGITRDSMLRKMTYDHWRAVLTTNLDSLYNVTRQFIEGMTERGFGRVINISSVNGQKGQAGQTNYSAAKAGAHGFTMALAQEVVKKGVTVNTISPGYMNTEMVQAIRPDILQSIVDSIPMGRLGNPAETAALIAFLASNEAGYITGANIAINGGLYMS